MKDYCQLAVLISAFLLTAPSGGRSLFAVACSLCCLALRPADVLAESLRAVITPVPQDRKEYPDYFAADCDHSLMAF